MTVRTKTKALATLDGLKERVRDEMLVRGEYYEGPEDYDDAMCNGPRACLLGSLWLAYGVKPEGVHLPTLPGITTRTRFLAHRPALRLAFDALNEAALRRVGMDADSYAFPASVAEDLFENGDADGVLPDRRALLSLVASARRIVEKAA